MPLIRLHSVVISTRLNLASLSYLTAVFIIRKTGTRFYNVFINGIVFLFRDGVGDLGL